MNFQIIRAFRPASQYRHLVVTRHQPVKHKFAALIGRRLNSNKSGTPDVGSSSNPAANSSSIKDNTNPITSKEAAKKPANAYSSAVQHGVLVDDKLKTNPHLAPEDVVKKGQEAELAQEKDDQENVQATTGVIEKKEREGLIYFSNIYPIAPVSSELVNKALSWAFGLTESRVVSRLTQNSIPADIPVTFTKLIPRYKDGGAFARYTIDKEAPQELTPKDVESVISQNMKTNAYHPVFNPFRRIKVFSVLGIPWIEDLHRRVSNKVRVVFEGGEVLSQEIIYSVLRRYGPIKDITTQNDPKDPVKSAIVEYLYTRDASTARNCVNSLIVQSTQIHITYIPSEGGFNAIKKSIMDHPRISVPLILAFLTTLAVFVFNPIRVWSIEHKITDTSLPSFIENNDTIKWVRGVTKETMTNLGKYLHRPADDLSNSFKSLWIERQQSVRQIKQWLQENVNTFIVVTGPRGNGKKDLVTNFVLKDRSNVLTIDCKQLTKAQNDSSFIRAAAAQLGYYPVFSWTNNIGSYLDLIIQGLTGQKSGFSESTEQQLKNMLTTATFSIRKVALKDYHSASKEEPKRSGDECAASPKITEDSYLQLHPESKPVVVIYHYLNRVDSSYKFVYKQLADFASVLVQANLAHVIFITDDITYEGTLTPALPNRIFKVAGVSDADSKDAKRFVLNQIMEARRTEAPALQDSNSRGKDGDEKKEKSEDLYTATDSEVDEAREKEQVDKMKEELRKEQEGDKGNIASRILTYTAGAFYSDEKSDSKEPENSGEHRNLDDTTAIESEFPYLDYALTPLGGRLTDLQSFARRLKSGEKPLDAAEDMVSQSASEIYQMFLNRNQRVISSVSASSAPVNEWTQEQAWTLIKLLGGLSVYGFSKERQIALAEYGRPAGSDRGISRINKHSNISHKLCETEPELSMSFLLQDPNFKTKEQQKALNALQQAEMITLVHENGRNVAIKAGKPLYQAAFKALICDKVLYSMQETVLLTSMIAAENKKIKGYEEEMQMLGEVEKLYGVKQRMGYLESKMVASQNNITKYEEKLKEMSGIMGGK